jgi:ABC-2 type transport system permease protein
MIRDNARILRCAAGIAIADLRVIYTWQTWVFAWLLRILCQVTFFALIGKLFDSSAETHYLLIGNSVFIVAMISVYVCVSAAWERQTGTLPLLIASPADPFIVFAGRGVNWLIDGTACATISLFALSPLFGLPLPWPRALLAIPIIICAGTSTYCFALVLAGLVLRKTELRNLIANLAYLMLMLLCGVEFPTTFFPAGLRFASNILPLTNGLKAIRDLLSGAPAGQVLTNASLEAVAGCGWLALAFVLFRRFANSSRKAGSIEFG